MHVILDSNILIADPWLKSQRTRVLLDYVRKTRSRVVVLDPVWQEVAAHTHRGISKAVAAVDAALRGAEQQYVSGLPTIDAAAVGRRNYDAWEAGFRARLSPDVAEWVPLEPSVLPEVVRRAARRLPPVRPDGSETRDAIIWLSLVHHVRGLAHADACAFVSLNTRDFAAPDKASLREELRPDLDGVHGGLAYYASVDAFLKKHAEPIGHITREWVTARLDVDWVIARVTDRLLDREPPLQAFRPVSIEFIDEYQPYTVERVVDVSPSLDDMYLYDAAPGLADVFLGIAVDVTVEAECYRTAVRGLALPPDEDGRERSPFVRHLTCAGGLVVEVVAIIDGDQLRLATIEGVGPR